MRYRKYPKYKDSGTCLHAPACRIRDADRDTHRQIEWLDDLPARGAQAGISLFTSPRPSPT